MAKIIIGLGHYSRVGKDTLANALVTEFKLRQVPARKRTFAWKLKQIAHELYEWAGVKEPEYYETPDGEKERDTVLPGLGLSVVELWIRLGNALRNEVYQETWITYLLSTLDEGATIIPDVRFPSEIAAIRSLGGSVVKIIRPGYAPRQSVSDRALLGFEDWDLILGQTGRIEDLHIAASAIASSVVETGTFPTQTLKARQRALKIEQKALRDAGIPV